MSFQYFQVFSISFRGGYPASMSNVVSLAPVAVLSALGLPKHPVQFQGSQGLS